MRRLSKLLARIIDDGLLDPSTSNPHEIASFYGRSPAGKLLTIQTNRKGEQLVDQASAVLHTELITSHNLSVAEVRDDVITTLVDAAVAKDEGKLDVPSLVAQLIERLSSDEGPWSVLWPIPSFNIPEEASLTVGRFIFGALSEDQLASIRTQHEEVSRSSWILKDGELRNALPAMQETFEETIRSCNCWALGQVTARATTIDRIAGEEIRISLAVIRTFALYLGINPDSALLETPANPNIRDAIFFRPGDQFSFLGARYERRIPCHLNYQQIERLQRFDLFQRAQAITASEHPTQLEQKILLAMLQFDTAATLDPPESKLPHYLTVIETLLAREEGEHRDRGKKASRRLTAFATSDAERSRLREDSRDLYGLRTGPVHRGSRGLRGRDEITPRDIERARLLAYFAILLSLQRSSSYQTCEDFIVALDAETN